MTRFVPIVLRSLALAAALLSCLTGVLVAQATGTIRGRVTDVGTGRPVPDVQIVLTGRAQGAITNASGDYFIPAAPSGTYTLTARRIGYSLTPRSVTVTAGAETRADFALRMSVSTLDAVVVTGTGGGAERRTLGNSITQLDVAELTEKTTVVNVTEVLQGKSPGVSILPGSGAPGTAGEIRIRGASSLSGYRPVVFIDGIRYNIDDLGSFNATGGGTAGLAQSAQVTSALNNLNPNDIESIEIIKGPAAATLYGAEAANGVIQIITKRGNRGQQRLQWGFKTEYGTSEWTAFPQDNMTTCEVVRDTLTVANVNAPGGRELAYPDCQRVGGTNFLASNDILRDNPIKRDDRAIRSGQVMRYSGSVRGGGDRYSYYLAGDRALEQGVFYNSDDNRTSLRTNFGFNANDKSDFAINLNYSNGRLRLPIQDESVNGLLLSSSRGQPGRATLGVDNIGWRTITPNTANRYKNFTESERLTLGATLNVNPRTWFQNRFVAGFDNSATQAQLLFLPGDIEVSQDPDAASGANLRNAPTRRILTLDYAGTLIWNARANLEATTKFGTQVVSDASESIRATGIGIGAPDVTLVNLLQRTTGGEGFSENNSVGYYVQEQLAWNNRLFLTGALRADDHSSFGTNFDLIVYPKLSASYVLSEEPAAQSFLRAGRINTAKLRGAWGQAGRAPTAYSASQTYTADRVTLGTNVGSAIRTAAFGNPDLKPEKGEEIELGFDLGMFEDKLGVDFTFYNKTTSDMLQSISVAPSTGFISSRIVNLGTVLNRGFEVAMFGTPFSRQNLSWDTRVNFSTNHNELTGFGVEGKVTDTPGGQAFGSIQQHRVGFPLGGYWVAPPLRCGVDPISPNAATTGPNACGSYTGAPQLTAGGAAIFNQGDSARRYMGSPVPTREIGFSNTVNFLKHFSLYALVDYKTGGMIFNQNERSRCQAANDNCARVNNPAARFPVTAADTILNREFAVYRQTAQVPAEFVQSTDFVKLREVSLSAVIPPRFLGRTGASSARFTLSGRNLGIWSDYEGADPEVNSYGGRNFVKIDAYAAPATRRITGALSLQF